MTYTIHRDTQVSSGQVATKGVGSDTEGKGEPRENRKRGKTSVWVRGTRQG